MSGFINALVSNIQYGYNWANTIGIALVATLMAISILSWLFSRS